MATAIGAWDTLDQVFAQVMGTEDALVRHSIVSGTHAITIALFGVLRPGDVLLAATGAPYDTLEQVIGMREASPGSLREYGIGYQEVSLAADGWPDIPAITRALRENAAVKAVHIQRSRGYSLRPSLPVSVIGDVIAAVRAVREDVVVFVDNCYGEFAERLEPSAVGADLMAGSLIKNPGGGIAENGGYICGRADLVEQCAYRMTTPGLGREVGASLGHNRTLYMGLFQAPHVVGEAMKTAVFASALFRRLGYAVTPEPEEYRADIIQAVQLKTPEALVAFCQGSSRGRRWMPLWCRSLGICPATRTPSLWPRAPLLWGLPLSCRPTRPFARRTPPICRVVSIFIPEKSASCSRRSPCWIKAFSHCKKAGTKVPAFCRSNQWLNHLPVGESLVAEPRIQPDGRFVGPAPPPGEAGRLSLRTFPR